MSHTDLINPLLDTIRRHKSGEPVGIYSVCSANPTVVRAAMQQAKADSSFVLIEATSNQVDQFGGYTGMRPADFRETVLGLADAADYPRELVVLGGDHLGPNRWQHRRAEEAMALAEDLVVAYVEAGYTKIHLDCSMACADDPATLTDRTVAGRAARLMRVAEDAARRIGLVPPVYVIGTEVPVPGGAHETLDGLVPTPAEHARRTLDAHRSAFGAEALDAVWPRVIALVVQPGVEFDHLAVFDYRRAATAALRHVLDAERTLVFEAHSTDYQQQVELSQLVEDHWAILKVGPELTFAMREALFALAGIESEIVAPSLRSDLVEIIERSMLADPSHWQGYYHGDSDTQRTARRYSYSDRLRYYWPDPQIDHAREKLLANLRGTAIPMPLFSQYLPDQYHRIRAGQLDADPYALVVDKVRDVLRRYAFACSISTGDA